ncbi:MAG: MFS transporter [Phycisphaerae bacterium SM23_30]|nr:MAG: MFS transporter [Phycisphaerae bacterium SM23_30]
MFFRAEEQLSDQQIQSGLRWIIRDGVTTQAIVTFTSGAFLIAFALKLGASNFVIGLLSAIVPLCQLLQLPAIFLVEKLRRRRAICVIAAGLSRTCWLFIALIPFLFSFHLGLFFVVTAIIVNSALNAFSGCSWNSWMRDLVPQDILGSFFSHRMRIAIGAGVVLSMAAAVYLDLWKKFLPVQEIYSYSLLFFCGFIAGMIGVYFISRIPEPKMMVHTEKRRWTKMLLEPLGDDNFRKLIMFLGSWNFAVNLAAPFFMVYMLKRLKLEMSLIIGLIVLSQIANIAFLKIWGKFTDKFSNKSVLVVCGPLFIFSILGWTFTTMPEKYFLTLPLLIIIHVCMGISAAGVTLATGNIGLKLAPQGKATAYLAANTMINSLAAGIAPILGGKFADFFAARQLDWTLKYTSPTREISFPTLNLQQWDFFFVLAFILGLYSLHRLSIVKEIGEVEEEIVMQELVTEVKLQVRTISSVAGLRHMVSLPVIILSRLMVKTEVNDAPID